MAISPEYLQILQRGLGGLGPGLLQREMMQRQQLAAQQQAEADRMKQAQQSAMGLLRAGYQPTQISGDERLGQAQIGALPPGSITPRGQLGQLLGVPEQMAFAPQPKTQPMYFVGPGGVQRMEDIQKGAVIRQQPKPSPEPKVAGVKTYAERIQNIYKTIPTKYKGMEETRKGFFGLGTEKPTQAGKYIISQLKLLGLPSGIKLENLDIDKIISETDRVLAQVPTTASQNQVNMVKRELNRMIRERIQEFIKR